MACSSALSNDVCQLHVSDRTITKLQSGPASKQSQWAQDIVRLTLGVLATGPDALAYSKILYRGLGIVNAIGFCAGAGW